MDIFQPDARPLIIFFMAGLVTVQQGIQLIQCILVHADAVIHDRQGDGVVKPLGHKLDMPRAVHRLNAVDKGIFHDGLQNQLGNQDIFQMRAIVGEGDLVAEPAVEQIDVFCQNIHLTPQRHKVVDGADDIAYLVAQSFNHIGHHRVVAPDSGHADDLQRVVQKVGVDLAFQRVQLRLGLLDFRQIHLFCIGVQLGAHLVEALGQIAQLIVAGHRDAAGKITGLDLAHVLHNGADGLGQLAGEEHRADDKRGHGQRDHQPHSPLHGADLRFDGGTALAAPNGQPVFGDWLGQEHRAGRCLRRHIQRLPHKCRVGGKIAVTGVVRNIDGAAVGQVQRGKQPVKHIGAQVQKERTQVFFMSDCAGNVVIVAPHGKDIRRARAAKADVIQRVGGHKPHFAAFGVPMLKIHRLQIRLTVKQGVIVVSQLVANHLGRTRRGIDKVGSLNIGVRHIHIVQKQPHFVTDAVSGIVRIGKSLAG